MSSAIQSNERKALAKSWGDIPLNEDVSTVKFGFTFAKAVVRIASGVLVGHGKGVTMGRAIAEHNFIDLSATVQRQLACQ